MKGEYKIGKKEYMRLYDKARHEADPERRWRLNLNRLGITPEIWYSMYDRQQGCCAICGKHQSNFKRKLDVDHNHTTGKVRALLCSSCNKNVGVYEQHAEKLAKYLLEYPQ